MLNRLRHLAQAIQYNTLTVSCRKIAYGGITSDYRGGYGSYWSSRPYSCSLTYSLYFNGDFDYFAMDSSARAYGFSVRCVQENQ